MVLLESKAKLKRVTVVMRPTDDVRLKVLLTPDWSDENSWVVT